MILYNYIIHPIENFYRIIYLLLSDWFGNYGIAVIALSLLSFILLYPFTRRANQIQQEELHLQKILQEQLRAIKEKYSGAEQFEKIQRLYDRFSYHPVMAIRSVFGLLIQLPFLLAVFYMLSNCAEIEGVSWGIVPDLGKPDALLHGINILPFLMTFVSILYAFIVPNFDRRQKVQTVIVSILFLLLLYSAPSALLIFWTCNILWSLLSSLLSKKLERVGIFIAENELAFHIVFALSLTVGLFVPLDVYVKNVSQLWFSLKEILKYFLADTTKFLIVLITIYIVCWRKNNKGIYLSVLLGLLFGVFLQSYVIGIDYGLFDGHEIQWGNYTKVGLLNTFIWLFCIGETFVVFKRFKFDLVKLKKYVKPIVFGIVAIQCIAMIFTLKNNPLPENTFQSKGAINVLTTKDIFNISSKDNIIVFLLDAFDAKIFEEIMKKDPEIIKQLNGFTFYPDTTSVYGYTDYSLLQILTGKNYNNDRPFVEYFEEAWQDVPFYKELIQKNYDIRIYTNGKYVSEKAPISNLISEKTVLNDESMHSFYNLVFFRMMPHFAKKGFYDYDPNAWMRLLANRNVQAYQEDDRKFYQDLKKGIVFRDDKNCFRFYHLIGAHVPFVLNRNVEPIGNNEKGSQYEQSVGAMKIVLECIKQMKHKGVFYSSTFVIMADHGDPNKVGSRPLLCVKYPKDNFSMKVSDNSVSLSEFLPILYHSFDNKNNRRISLKERLFYFIDEEKGFIAYKILGNAKDKLNWVKVNTLIDNEKQDNSYVLGEGIDFTLYGNSKKYKRNGWSTREELLGTWSLGSDADLSFKIKDYKNQNLNISFVAWTYLANLPYRTAKVYVNKTFLQNMIFDNENGLWSLKIPSSLMDGNSLNIHFSIDHSDVAINYENNDERHLGIFMQKMRIEPEES